MSQVESGVVHTMYPRSSLQYRLDVAAVALLPLCSCLSTVLFATSIPLIFSGTIYVDDAPLVPEPYRTWLPYVPCVLAVVLYVCVLSYSRWLLSYKFRLHTYDVLEYNDTVSVWKLFTLRHALRDAERYRGPVTYTTRW